VSEPLEPTLDVRLTRRVHAGLTVDVSIALGREIGIVFGASGAGKTTLLRLIAGLARPDSGQIRLDGAVLFDSAKRIDQPLRRRRVGMIFQDDCLFPHLSVAANIRFGLKGWSRDQAANRLEEVAALCGVEHLMNRCPETLSGGERQRVGLARALAPQPLLLLCDEPVSALDLANRDALIERLRTAQRAQKIPILYVTHSPAEAVALGSRLFLLDHGKLIAEGPALDILSTASPAARGTSWWEGLRNVFPGRILDHPPDRSATSVMLDHGPSLFVPRIAEPPETPVLVKIRADEIIVARQPITGLSARNQIAGTIERVVFHGVEAEAMVRTGSLTWIISLTASAVEELALDAGCPVQMIVKSRSCHVSVS
jgi:molybdate transport system ATP-binding protein